MDTDHACDRISAAMLDIGQIIDDYRQTPHARAEWLQLADLLRGHAHALDQLGIAVRSAAKSRRTR
jgi:hypothetical protein